MVSSYDVLTIIVSAVTLAKNLDSEGGGCPSLFFIVLDFPSRDSGARLVVGAEEAQIFFLKQQHCFWVFDRFALLLGVVDI
jgi:hypothetical protein